MKRFRERKSWIVLIAVLLLLAACKGETPTAPPPGGGGTPGGGTTPPTGVTLTLATTNSSPLIDSSVTITATATLNGAPVPNGTAVEFVSTSGSLNGSGTAILRTTTNGISTVTLTATTTGLVRVSATVNNVTRTIDITFVARPVVDPPIATTPTISSITPSIGRPAGGQVIRIVGTNFKSPVRVLFDTGGPLPVEGSVQSVSDTVIEVITPPVNLGSGQELKVDVIVLTQAGSTTEQRVELADGFTYRNEQLTPIIHTVTPNSGPVTGGTRVTILGEGFQEPVQVLFNTAEARVLNITYGQILVETPAARDTNPNGSGTVTGPVTVLVRNINSNTSGTMAGGFLYKAAMQITAVSPLEGPSLGGTRVTIDGIGFISPVAVTIAGVAAQPISVTGTKIVVLTPAIVLSSCQDVVGGIVVTNIVNGDQAEGPEFVYRVPPPTIIDVSPDLVLPGGTITVVVANAQPGITRFLLRGLEADDDDDADIKTVFPTNVVFAADGTATFTLSVPTNFRFEPGSCFTGGQFGERLLDLFVDVTYLHVQSGCTDIAEDVFTVDIDNGCVPLPSPEITQTAPVPPSCAIAANTPVGLSNTTSISFSNNGNALLIITPDAPAGPNASEFVVTPANTSIPPDGAGSFTVTFTPAGLGLRTATVTFVTNDTDEGRVTVCLQGTGI